MAKYIIYLGETKNKKYRVALFDDSTLLNTTVPVKDCDFLPDIPMLNCSVRNGKPFPNLGGSKVLCTASDQNAKYVVSTRKKTPDPFDYRKLWADPSVRPDYAYAEPYYTEGNIFTPGSLLASFGENFNTWDGLCKKNNWYLVASLVRRVSRKRFAVTKEFLLVSSEGRLLTLNSGLVKRMFDNQCVIQAGTPVLHHNLGKNTPSNFITIAIPDNEDSEMVFYHNKNSCDSAKGINIWEIPSAYYSTLLDLRKFVNAKLFGPTLPGNYQLIAFPEGVEEIWAAFTHYATGVRRVYLPKSTKSIVELGLQPVKIKTITFYSESPAVESFANRVGAGFVSCKSADDMIKTFYSATDSDSVSADTAGAIANLAGIQSQNGDFVADTVLSAMLLSCQDKGLASDVLEQKFPIVHTVEKVLQGNYAFPYTPTDLTEHSYTRLLVAAFTLFYPCYTNPEIFAELKPYPNVPSREVKEMCYILGKDYAVIFRDHPNPPSFLPKNYTVHVIVAKLDTGYFVDRNSTIVLGDMHIVHSFICTLRTMTTVFDQVLSLCKSETEPSGVFRYADKIRSFTRWSYAYNSRPDLHAISYNLVSSFFPVMYGTKRSLAEYFGIDLHTGNFVTMQARYDTSKYTNKTGWFNSLTLVQRIVSQQPDWSPIDLIAQKSAYLGRLKS